MRQGMGVCRKDEEGWLHMAVSSRFPEAVIAASLLNVDYSTGSSGIKLRGKCIWRFRNSLR